MALTKHDETGKLFFDRASVARLKVEWLPGWPQPFVVAIVGTAGGSTALFETSLAAPLGRRWAMLLPPTLTNTDGGFHVGDLGSGLGPGVATWGRIWGGEARVEPARYWVRRLRWNGHMLVRLPTLESKGRYADPDAALRELGIAYVDVTLQFPDFEQLR